MRQRGWRGTTLFVSLLAVLGATLGVKFYSAGSQPASTTSQPTTSTGPSAAQSTPTAAGGAKTITGDAISTRYGNVQVRVSFAGTNITKVTVLQVPDQSGRDQEITGYSVPILNKEVLQSQSAKVDSVSGATYTSDGYLRSLQSAIDKLG
ncbi:MAG TPA: FMN-binding protein [Microbacteriaceae bacterium]|jgi:uncharacterized protein with FMN-binding domain|nr:FMN-binding protein [Microbacteriaceae bacterium]